MHTALRRGVVIALGALLALAGWAVPEAAEAAVIKNVISATQALSATNPVNIDLGTTVDITRAFVVCTNSTTNTTSVAQRMPTCILDNGGTGGQARLQIQTGAASATGNVRYYVAEFSSGVSVQRGTMTFDSAAGDTVLSQAVSVTGSPAIANSFVLTSTRSAITTATDDERWNFKAVLSGSTTLTLSRLETGTTGTAQVVAWQVVTMDSATVQRGTTCIGNTSGTSPCVGSSTSGAPQTRPVTVSAFDTNKSMLLVTRTGGTAVAGTEGLYQVRGSYTANGTAATGLTFSRAVNNTATNGNSRVEIAWQLVSFSDGTTVRHNALHNTASATSIAASGTTASPTFTTGAVDTTRAIPFVTSINNNTGSGVLDESQLLATVSSTGVSFVRGTTTGDQTLSWMVVQFSACATANLCNGTATSGNTTNTINLKPADGTLILRKHSSTGASGGCSASVTVDTCITDAPADGTTYTVGSLIGTSMIVHNGSDRTFTQTGCGSGIANDQNNACNGTTYFYKVFHRRFPATGTAPDYDTAAPVGVKVAPQGVGQSGDPQPWSYHLPNGSALNAPISGGGRLFSSSNASKIFVLNSLTGAEQSVSTTTGPVESYITWYEFGATGTQAVVAADTGGKVYSIDPTTGTLNWSVQLKQPDLVSDAIVWAPISVQTRAFADSRFTSSYSDGSYDVIFVATANSGTENSLIALRSDTGAVLWRYDGTFLGSNPMGYVFAQPAVDYGRNRIYLGTYAGDNSDQVSLWVINTADDVGQTKGQLTTPPPGGFSLFIPQTDFRGGPSMSMSGDSLYVGGFGGSGGGNLYAYDLNTLTQRWSHNVASGSNVKGYVWEDFDIPGQLYVITENGRLTCVTDDGAAGVQCWQKAPAGLVGGSITSVTLSQPLLGSGVLWLPGTTVSSGPVTEARIYEIDLTTGDTIKNNLVGDGSKTAGDLSTDDGTYLYAGTSEGRVFAIPLTGGTLP